MIILLILSIFGCFNDVEFALQIDPDKGVLTKAAFRTIGLDNTEEVYPISDLPAVNKHSVFKKNEAIIDLGQSESFTSFIFLSGVFFTAEQTKETLASKPIDLIINVAATGRKIKKVSLIIGNSKIPLKPIKDQEGHFSTDVYTIAKNKVLIEYIQEISSYLQDNKNVDFDPPKMQVHLQYGGSGGGLLSFFPRAAHAIYLAIAVAFRAFLNLFSGL